MTPPRLGLPAALLLVGAVLAPGCAARRTEPAAAVAAPVAAAPDTAAWQVLEAEAGAMDATVRGEALATLLAGAPAPELATWAARAAWDPSPWVQRRAAEALAERRTEPAAAEALRAVLLRPGLDPVARCLGARPAPEPAVLDAVRAQASASGTAPQACQLLLAEHGDDAAGQALLDALRRGRLRLDLDLSRALAGASLPGLDEALVEGAGRVEEVARTTLGSVLLARGHREGRRLLEQALAEPDPTAGLEVIDRLLELRSPESTELLRHAARTAPPAVAAYARAALLAHGDNDAALLRALAEESDPQVLARGLRGVAAALRARPGDAALRRAARRLAQAALQVDRPEVALAAAPVAQALADPSLAPLLAPWLDDEDTTGRLRVAVATALLAIGG